MTNIKHRLLTAFFVVTIISALGFLMFPYLSFFLVPAYPEMAPSKTMKAVPYVYEEIAANLWEQQGLYVISADDNSNIVLLKLENDGSYNKLFIKDFSENALLINTNSPSLPDYIRVFKNSVAFEFGEMKYYRLIYSKSLASAIIDLYQTDLLKEYHLVKRVSKNWYFFYY